MAIVVNTNVSALMAQRNLNSATNSLSASIERMSSGYKINRAADDAAGLAIATNMNTKIRGSEVAQSNIQQGINVLQTAEGYLSGITDNINRIRDLAAQAANGINSSDSKAAIIKEVNARVAEINKQASSAEFNGVKLLDGSANGLADKGMRLQVGADSAAATNAITVDKSVFANASAGAIGLSTAIDAAFATATSAALFMAECDSALKDITTRRADIGAYQNRLTANYDALTVSIENLSASKSTIMDVDVAKEASKLTKSQILQQASTQLLAQANQTPSIALSLL